jgi:hypothetical protein
MSPGEEWDLAQGIPALSAPRVLSGRLRAKCRDASDPSDKTESQLYHIAQF